MKSIRLYIEKAGLQTTFQDVGRLGLRAYGIPTSGAMDKISFKLANQLVGNSENTPILEMTLRGDTIHFLNHTTLAITGADMSPKLNGQLCPMYKTIFVEAGDVLRFGFAKDGCRTYLAIQGKPNINFDFNSYSTYIYGGFGGFKGRALKNDDVIQFENDSIENVFQEIQREQIPIFQKEANIRIIPAPEFDWFSKRTHQQFFANKYQITADSNRMGIKLKGEPILPSSTQKMISSPTAIGTIQVLPSGQLIVLMNDGQTTGGYPRIANVVVEDLDKLAQIPVNGTINFALTQRMVC